MERYRFSIVIKNPANKDAPHRRVSSTFYAENDGAAAEILQERLKEFVSFSFDKLQPVLVPINLKAEETI